MDESAMKMAIKRKMNALAMETADDPIVTATVGQRTDRFKRLKAEFIKRTGIPIDEINGFTDEEDEPYDFKLDWLGPYGPVICMVAGREGTTEHITLTKAIQSKIQCPAFHIDYAAVPSNQKATYGRKVRDHIRSKARELPDCGLLIALTAKEGFVRGVQDSEYLNIPKAISYFANSVLVTTQASRLSFAFLISKARLHKPHIFAKIPKNEVLLAAEQGVVYDFNFQDFQ